MILRRLLIALWFVLVAGCLAGFLVTVWVPAHTPNPTPKTESAFFRNYNPRAVIDHFPSVVPFDSNTGRGSGADRHFVTHDAEFESHFAMRKEKSDALMNALVDDISAQLRADGAETLTRTGDAASGFRFEYKLGNTVGAATVLPLTPASPDPRLASPPAVQLTSHVEIREKWFPKGTS